MTFDLQKRKAQFLARRAARKTAAQTRHYLDAYLAHINKTPILREAYALSAYWQNAEIEFFPEELIAGMILSNEPVGFHYGFGTYVAAEDADIVKQHSYQRKDPSFISERELLHLESHASSTTWFGGHMVLDFETVFAVGLDGYREKLQSKPTNDFYKAMEVTLDGVVKFILRLAQKAEAACCGPVADVLHHIAHKPPETFHQGLQLCWVLHYLDNSDSFGRFDKYLNPLFAKEEPERAKELLTDFWLKIEDAEEIQNMTIGGTGVYSGLTLLCLEVTRQLAFKGPNLCLRVTPDIPADIWDAALDCIGAGLGLPALYNDGLYSQSLINFGIPAETAENYCFAGCSQLMIPGESNFYNDIGMMNIAKIFELTLYNGFDPRIGKQVGVTHDTICDFESLMTAFFAQLKDACDIQVEFHNKELRYRASREGYALRSLFTKDCLEKGLGVFEGGARYNNIQLELIGITNAADSLLAIKKAVFEEKRLSFARLCDILKSNWEGQDNLRAYFRSLPKFGNDIDEVDGIRAKITKFLYEYFNSAAAALGGCYVPGEVIFTAHEHCGAVTGATPDGRAAGDVLADSAGAQAGCGIAGPTALMNSVFTIPTAGHLLTSVVLNLRFLPNTFGSARPAISALLSSFFAGGGMQVQINVVSSQVLRDAQNNPHLYGDLIVRVGGYSDYFVRLSAALQNEIIERAELM